MIRCILLIAMIISSFPAQSYAEEKLISAYTCTERMISLAVSEDYVWCGTWEGGAARYDRRDGSWKTFTCFDGLASNSVQAIFVDREGGVWFASPDYGISYYDGMTWTRYSMDDGLPTNKVSEICEDARGQMWCSTQEGVCRLRDGTWQLVLSGGSSSIAAGSDSTVWCAQGDLILHFDGTTWRTYTGKETGVDLSYTYVKAVDKNNTMWFNNWGGSIASFDGSKWKVHAPSGSIQEIFGKIVLGPDGNAWVENNGNIYRFNDNKQWEIMFSKKVLDDAFAVYGYTQNGDLLFIPDSTGVLWYIDPSLYFGYEYFPGLMKIENGKMDIYRPECMALIRPMTIAQDNKGDMWIGGSYATGISRFDGKTWTTFNGFKGVAYYDIYSIIVDRNDTVWIATPNGVLRYDGVDWKLLTQLNSGLKYDKVSVIYEDSKGVLWFGTQGGVSSYDGSAWNYYNSANTGTDLSEIKNIVEDGEGILWVNCKSGLVGYDGKTWGKNTLFPEEYNTTNIASLAIGPDGSLWGLASGREGGQYSPYHNLVFHLQNGTWSKLMMPADPSGLNSITVDRKNILWIGGRDQNVALRFDGESWRGYGVNDRLATKEVYTIFVDKNNVKWVGAEDGLFCIGEDSVSGIFESNEAHGVFPALSIYPNPFNLSVSLGFTLPSPGETNLTIYSITGQKVKQVVYGFLPAGKQMVTWNGRDDYGREVSSGVYIARLKAGDHFSVRRMTLVK